MADFQLRSRSISMFAFGRDGVGAVPLDDPAETYHESSKWHPHVSRGFFSVQRFLTSPHLLELGSRPSRRIGSGTPIPLPSPIVSSRPLVQVLESRRSSEQFVAGTATVDDLSTVLYAAYGVIRDPHVPDRGKYKFRITPSAGGLYPLEVYALVLRADGIEQGLYHYEPYSHALFPMPGQGDIGRWTEALVQPDIIQNAAIVLIVTASFLRTRLKYGLRGFRFAMLEAGHLSQNVLLAAESAGLTTRPVGGYFDTRVDDLVTADGVNESVIHLVAIGGRVSEAAIENESAPTPSADALAPKPVTGPVIASFEKVSQRYGPVMALAELDLEVHQGEIIALLGPNGAGKTTAISLITGLRLPDAGRVRLFGRDPREPSAREVLGTTPQETGFPPTLTIREVLDFARAHYPNPVDTEELIESFGLTHIADRATGRLSVGERRRLAVALAFSGKAAIVVLDEPTAGLDVEARRLVWDGVRRYAANGGTVLLTTHYIEEAEALASRIMVLRKGKLVADGTVDAIRAQVSGKRVSFTAPRVPRLNFHVNITTKGTRHFAHCDDADGFVRALVASGEAFSDLEVATIRLEEAFLKLTDSDQ